MAAKLDRFQYDDEIVKKFLWITLLWGVVGMLVGVIIAIQIFWPTANLGIPYTTFGRLRPLHTNAVIFAFCGNAIFAGIYYSTQRLVKARLFSDLLSKLHFWGWQAIIVSAAITLPLGLTQSKEYAELEWPIDIAITVVWVVFAINFFGTLWQRRERTLYVAIWFYVATILTVAMLHIVNSLVIPAGLFKSYPIYTGVQDALVQWWYGHNAVAFFLTTPFLGLAYYFIPKAVNKPIYSYRLSIIHFWALIFLYIWAGPHHLAYSALPEWLQSLGMVFSVMLLAPSWGGAINFVLTLRNGWDKLRTEPVVKFFAAAVTFYMMATFEGPLLSIKSVNAISHNTDWTIGHVHGGALGWNGFIIFGMCYWLVPKLYKTKLHSSSLANLHFWMATGGIALYVISMWVSGVTQGIMNTSMDASGILRHPNFLEIMNAVIPLHMIRALGGATYLAGAILGIYNLWRTAQNAPATTSEYVEAAPLKKFEGLKESKPWTLGAIQELSENRFAILAVLSLIAVAIGGAIEIMPLLQAKSETIRIDSVKPYTALELQGRDIYIREGCNNCHTQQVRPILGETKRYKAYSRAGEFVYDTPHLWGSKRTGPDLHRVGRKYDDLWHYKHLMDPRSVSTGSVMPAYAWLGTDKLNNDLLQSKYSALRMIGVPYTQEEQTDALTSLATQASAIAANLKNAGETVAADSEVIAVIAYLQRLGTDFKEPDVATIPAVEVTP